MNERNINTSDTYKGLVERARRAFLAINPESSVTEVTDASALLRQLNPEDRKSAVRDE